MRAIGDGSPTGSDTGRGPAGLARHAPAVITEAERRRWRAELKRASIAELLAGERERARLSRDLHDDVGQLLALIGLKLQTLRDQLPARERAASEEIDDLVKQVAHRIASLTFQLHPPILDSEGLESAARWLGEALRQSHELKVELDTEGDLASLDRVTRVVLFRCLRELLLNVAKHTDAKDASVRITRCAGHAELVVEDQGRGSHPEPRRQGFGLASMCERLRALGGSFELTRARGGAGSRARVLLPIPPTDRPGGCTAK